jgi:hypothetical protein
MSFVVLDAWKKGGFINIRVPQNEWFISWKIMFEWMSWGYPILGNLHIMISK